MLLYTAQHCTNPLQSLLSLPPDPPSPHPLPLSHHAADSLAGVRLACLLQHTFQQQRVLGEPLVGLHQHVRQLQPVALLVRLRPLREEKGSSHTYSEHKS